MSRAKYRLRNPFARFGRSAAAALRGIGTCIRTERHMRIHLAATVLTLAVSVFFDWTPLHYAALLIVCGLVMAAELVNTAVERLTDAQTPHFSTAAGTIKDIAAGAVLLCALIAVGVGGCLFAQRAGWARLIRFLAHPGWGSIAALALAAGLIAFVGTEPSAWIRKIQEISAARRGKKH